MTNKTADLPESFDIIEIPLPKLTELDRLYVRAYLSSLSHSHAHKVVCPNIAKGLNDNQFSRKANIQYHISLGMQEKAEALNLTPELILEKLFKEATREGKGSAHNARVSALQVIGDYLGMFKKEEPKEQIVFHVVDYKAQLESNEVGVKVLEELPVNKIEGIEFIEYKEFESIPIEFNNEIEISEIYD